MDTSLINDIEDDEVVDYELGINEKVISEKGISQITRDLFTVNSLFILIYEEDDEYIDKLLIVEKESDEQDKILLKDENENDEFLYFDTDDTLILKNEFYSIIEIEKVEEFTDNIDEVELSMVQEMYPDIDIEVEEIKDKIYSIKEKKENLITELIAIYKAYNNDSLIYQITDMVEQLMKIYTSEDKILDDSDTLYFVKRMMNNLTYTLPKWILPVVNNKKKLYKGKEEQEEQGVQEDIIIQNFDEEIVQKHQLFSTEDIHYQKEVSIVHSYNPYESYDTLKIPYHGPYLRNCKSPCNGLRGSLSFDMNQTKNEFIIPLQRKDKTTLETLSSKEQLSLNGFYTLPHTFLDKTMITKHLSLHELYFLSNFQYSYLSLKDRVHDKALPYIINKETINEGDNLKENIHYYILEDNDITLDELSLLLKQNLPGYTLLLQSIPKHIQNVIYNFSDLRRAYLSYDLDYFSLDKGSRIIVNELIQKNIRNYINHYNRSVKRAPVQRMKKKKVILSTKDRIRSGLDFIMNLHVIPLRNHYLKRFFDVFSREPHIDENQNYLYVKGSQDKLLCKHYLYECQSHKDPESFNLLKSIYGDEVSDGIITCKVCNCYICHEEFSLLEGFSDGAPTSSREVLDVNKDKIHGLSEEQIKIKKRIHKITSVFGIQLNNHDKHEIIEYYDLFNNEEFINERYGFSIKEHPEYKEIKGNYKFIKQALTKKDQLKNISNNKLFNKDLSPFKQYLLDSNGVFIDTFFILFFIQTSIPSYPTSPKLSVDLWDFSTINSWEEIKQDLTSKIVIKTIDTIKKVIQRMIQFNRKNKFWNNIHKLLTEFDLHKEIPSFHQQFLNITEFILKSAKVRDKLKTYFDFKKTNIRNAYLKEYWVTYKPLFDNRIVLSINQKTNEELDEMKDYLLKNGTEYMYENISSIRPFHDAYENPRFKQLKIPFSEIMKNESYERLFNYAIHLHGKAPSIPIINLLIHRFIQTITDTNIENMLEKIGWSSSFKKLNNIEYSEFRDFFIRYLTDYFKKKNPDDKDTINIYIHSHMNNWNGMLLNGHSKRNYVHTSPIIYPNESYEDLLQVEEEEGEGKGKEETLTKNFVNELFNRYCLDDKGQINEKYSIDQFIFNILPDPDIERSKFCHKPLPKTKENFYKILDHKRQQSKLPLPNFIQYDHSIESRIREFIRDNNLLSQNADVTYTIFRTLYDFTEDTPEKEYRILFNDMFTHNSSMINRIQGFFHNNDHLDKDQLERYRHSLGRGIDSMSVPMNKMLESTEKIPSMITHLFHILSRLSNEQLVQHGTYFHSYIPKQWKLSDTNKEHLQGFLDNNEFSYHNDVFIPQKERKEIGFYQYQKGTNYALCFQGFFDFLKQFYQKGYHTLIPRDNSPFLEEYSNIMNRFIILFLFCKMIDYIEDLEDEGSEASNHANTLFASLEEQDSFKRSDSIHLCTKFTFDILIDLFESFIDPLWIYQSGNLADKLSRQREREKQTILDSLDNKTDDERHAMIHKQKCGLSNHFRNAEKENSSHIQTESYQLKTNDERSELAKELFFQNEVELEFIEGMGINTSHLQPGFQGGEEEEYTPEDHDREGEGLDDHDDSGNYRED
tara:strand:- start:6909 stop:11696 length:4788 start_codon:yes stop_codon:yes gene_type:complete